MVKLFLKSIPVPTAGLALGVIALGKLFAFFIPVVEPVCVAISLVFIVLITAKALVCRKELAKDLHQPIQAAVFGTFFMTYMQLSTYLASWSITAGRILWVAAVVGHFLLMAWFTRERIQEFKLGDVFATWFVCYVGIIVGSVTSPAVHLVLLGQFLFWFGFIAYLVLLFLVTARHAKISLTAGAAPTFCIYAAPMSLSIAGYLAVYEQPLVLFVVILEVLAQLLFVLVLFKLPGFLRTGFFPSYAAMTFPFVITATALYDIELMLGAIGVQIPFVVTMLFWIEALFACAMTVFVVGCFVRFFIQKLKGLQHAARAAHGLH